MFDIFKDDKTQEQYNQYGFVVVDLINKDIIDDVKTFYSQYQEEFESSQFKKEELKNFDHLGDYSYFNDKDDPYWTAGEGAVFSETASREIKLALREKYFDYMDKKLNEILKVDYRTTSIGLFVKKGQDKEKRSHISFHNHPTNIDESKGDPLVINIAIDEMSAENGGEIGTVPLSHGFNPYRAQGITLFVDKDMQETMGKYAIYVPLKPGQALISHAGCFHSTQSNNTNESRVSLAVEMIPQDTDAVALQYNRDNDGVIESVSFYEYSWDGFHHAPEQGKLIETKPYTFPKVTEEDLKQMVPLDLAV